jgi:hypothetical protein
VKPKQEARLYVYLPGSGVMPEYFEKIVPVEIYEETDAHQNQADQELTQHLYLLPKRVIALYIRGRGETALSES